LVEFSDEIEESVINALQAIGCDTAKSVLELDVADLVRRTGLTEDVIEDVKQVLQSEFED
jgi:N utilization substance protein A